MGDPDRKVGSPAAYIDDSIAGSWRQGFDRLPLPGMVKPEAQQGVHEVVFAGDGIEMPQNVFRLLIRGDLAESKVGGFAFVVRRVAENHKKDA